MQDWSQFLTRDGGEPAFDVKQGLWRICPFSGVTGHGTFTGLKRKYSILPYPLDDGDEYCLGRWNMVEPSPYVSRVQCIVKVLSDGTAILE
jgi:hypothetical protein